MYSVVSQCTTQTVLGDGLTHSHCTALMSNSRRGAHAMIATSSQYRGSGVRRRAQASSAASRSDAMGMNHRSGSCGTERPLSVRPMASSRPAIEMTRWTPYRPAITQGRKKSPKGITPTHGTVTQRWRGTGGVGRVVNVPPHCQHALAPGTLRAPQAGQAPAV